MSRIAIVTPTLPERRDWVRLQDAWYSDCAIERHYSIPGNAFEAVRAILPDVKAKYIVFAGDDDFHFPMQLIRMAQFLDATDYAGAYGSGILCQVENWQIGWTADYQVGMRMERAFSLMHANVFRKAIEQACTIAGRGREAMNRQNVAFREEAAKHGEFHEMSGLQLIHCHHSGRGELETTESRLKRLAERCGGGWLASWLPSRACSLRNLRRKRSPYYYSFGTFERTVETFKNSLHHPEFALARG